jgi:hypothetical protein
MNETYHIEKIHSLHNKDLKVVQAKPRPVPEGLIIIIITRITSHTTWV